MVWPVEQMGENNTKLNSDVCAEEVEGESSKFQGPAPDLLPDLGIFRRFGSMLSQLRSSMETVEISAAQRRRKTSVVTVPKGVMLTKMSIDLARAKAGASLNAVGPQCWNSGIDPPRSIK